MVMPSTLAVIPARGGSSRIKKKNIVDCGGKPLMVWTIQAALQSGVFSDVLVSTDDKEIAEIARNHGATVPFLRDKYADNQSGVALAVCYAVEQYEHHGFTRADNIALLQPNSPLLSAQDIADAHTFFVASGAPAQGCCMQSIGNHPWWGFTLNEKNEGQYLFPEKRSARSQDLEQVFFPSGAICFAKRDVLLQEKTFTPKGYIYYKLSWKAAFDIDTIEDLQIANALLAQ